MLFVPNKAASKKQLIERGLFFFPESVAQPELSTIVWEDFARLCAEQSVTSAASVNDDGIVLNPARGYSDDGTRRYLHTRPVFVTYYYSNNGGTIGTMEQISSKTTRWGRLLDRHFAVDLDDAQSFVRSTNPPNAYGTRVAHGASKADAVLSVSLVSATQGSTVSGTNVSSYDYTQALAYAGAVGTYNYGSSSNGYGIKPANIGTADALDYRTFVRQVNFNNSGGRFYTQLIGVDHLYVTEQGTPGPTAPTWALSAYYDAYGNLTLAKLDGQDMSSVIPVLAGAGTAKLREDLIDVDYVYEL